MLELSLIHALQLTVIYLARPIARAGRLQRRSAREG